MLDTSKWKKFNYSDLFEIKGSTTTKIEDLVEYGEGSYPYVTTQAVNNGVAGFYNYYTEEGNCLVVDSAVLGTCTYQKKNFSASDHVEVLVPKFKMNENIALFLSTIINMEQYKYSYGRKRSQTKLRNEYLLLPVNSQGKPDWKYMDEFMEKLENLERESKASLKDSIVTKGVEKEINPDNWKEYRLGDLFDVVYGVNLELQDLTENQDGYNFVSRTESNNGVSARVEKNYGEPNPGKTISVAGGGSVLSTFYQEEPYYSGRDLFYLESKEDISRYAKLFVCTIIKANKYKYNYGRQANRTMSDIMLALPSKKDGSPDWAFMEKYIKSLPYGDRI